MKFVPFGEIKDLIHINENAIMPEVCPILAVGLIFLSSEL
jgi:hypothetical protein